MSLQRALMSAARPWQTIRILIMCIGFVSGVIFPFGNPSFGTRIDDYSRIVFNELKRFNIKDTFDDPIHVHPNGPTWYGDQYTVKLRTPLGIKCKNATTKLISKGISKLGAIVTSLSEATKKAGVRKKDVILAIQDEKDVGPEKNIKAIQGCLSRLDKTKDKWVEVTFSRKPITPVLAFPNMKISDDLLEAIKKYLAAFAATNPIYTNDESAGACTATTIPWNTEHQRWPKQPSIGTSDADHCDGHDILKRIENEIKALLPTMRQQFIETMKEANGFWEYILKFGIQTYGLQEGEHWFLSNVKTEDLEDALELELQTKYQKYDVRGKGEGQEYIPAFLKRYGSFKVTVDAKGSGIIFRAGDDGKGAIIKDTKEWTGDIRVRPKQLILQIDGWDCQKQPHEVIMARMQSKKKSVVTLGMSDGCPPHQDYITTYENSYRQLPIVLSIAINQAKQINGKKVNDAVLCLNRNAEKVFKKGEKSMFCVDGATLGDITQLYVEKPGWDAKKLDGAGMGDKKMENNYWFSGEVTEVDEEGNVTGFKVLRNNATPFEQYFLDREIKQSDFGNKVWKIIPRGKMESIKRKEGAISIFVPGNTHAVNASPVNSERTSMVVFLTLKVKHSYKKKIIALHREEYDKYMGKTPKKKKKQGKGLANVAEEVKLNDDAEMKVDEGLR